MDATRGREEPEAAESLHPLRDETDAAFLYRQLAASEPDRSRADVYRRLAELEDRHVPVWTKVLAEKVREELGIGESRQTPLREGLVTGVATAVGALIPVAPFLLLPEMAAMWTSFAISMLSHFAVGAARSMFTGRGFLRSGVDMFLVGFGVATAGYLVAELMARLL